VYGGGRGRGGAAVLRSGGYNMNKKLLVTWAAVFLVWFFGSYLIHGVLLSGDYGSMPGLFRSMADQQKHFAWLLLGHVLFAGAFV
jgi:hypothetical protein